MCGIAGLVDVRDRREVSHSLLKGMADQIIHRGPDEDGYFAAPGVGLANRRLSIIGLADGQQPITNEDGSVVVVFNGELFDYPEQKAALESRGHVFRTHCDTEIIPHLYEEHGERVFEHLRGQFAIALWDKKRRLLLLGRDRFGICPLHWAQQDGWVIFGSEIKAVLASDLVEPRVDIRGINHVFTFFALPGPVTCFEGVQLLPPGHYLKVECGEGRVSEHAFWEIDFPDRGQEEDGDERTLVDRFEQLMIAATEERLRADVPVVAYLSGGVDSSTVVALASHVRKSPIPTFTIRITDPALDEVAGATLTARHVGTEPIVVNCGPDEVLNVYPELIRAAEGPVIDTSCTAMLLLAREVHAHGFRVTLTGEGADEWLAGYPWYKVHRLLSYLDFIPGVPLSQLLRRAYLKWTGTPTYPWATTRRIQELVGGHNPWLDIYGLVGLSRLRFFSPWLKEQLKDHIPFADLGLPRERLDRWHPLNRALWFGARVHLPGLLLNAKGDRVAMHSSVEARYPFLDEDVFAFLAKVHPRWKLRGFRDKYLLRRLAERWLPRPIARRSKAMFRAPLDSFHQEKVPPFVEQLLSEESLRKTGYFDVEAVRHWRKAYHSLRPGSVPRTSVEMGLVGVLATQLWHHTFLDASLADLPGYRVAMLRAG